MPVIELSETAREHFEKLIAQQNIAQLGIRLRSVDAGTPKGDCQLEFCEPSDLRGDEWTMDCGSFSLHVEAASVGHLEGAVIDYMREATGGQLSIKAPHLRGAPPDAKAGLFERVSYVIQTEINPQLAGHNGRVTLREVTPEGVVVLQFGGGCHGCGMVDVTLRDGVQRTLSERVPEVTGVRDATDHETGEQPYFAR